MRAKAIVNPTRHTSRPAAEIPLHRKPDANGVPAALDWRDSLTAVPASALTWLSTMMTRPTPCDL
jgi:hypothetical protein